jgi:hypothetical protein
MAYNIQSVLLRLWRAHSRRNPEQGFNRVQMHGGSEIRAYVLTEKIGFGPLSHRRTRDVEGNVSEDVETRSEDWQ